MTFEFNAHSSLLLPFVVPGAALTLFLLVRAARTGSRPDLLLALLIAWPTLAVTQWLLGYAGWYDSHDALSTFMFYVPWQIDLLLGPLWFLYFRALTNQEFRLRAGSWRHLLPGLAQIALWAAVALWDLGYRHSLQGQPLPDHFGTKGAGATWLDNFSGLLSYAGYALLLVYGLATLRAYRRYRSYLNDNFSETERLRFAGLRQVLSLLMLSLVLSLLYTALEALTGPFSYDDSWYGFVLRGVLIYVLAVVGLQANYAAATSPLRFEPAGGPGVGSAAPDLASEASTTIPGASTAMPPASDPTPGVSQDLSEVSTAVLQGAAPAPGGAKTLVVLAPDIIALRTRLMHFMQTERPYLEPELSLAELAQRLRTTPGSLSKVINAGCGLNFNDFVNSYRVAEARRQLADPARAHYSLVGVALDSGFNSKSTFNRVFKKLTGQAPSELARPKS